MKKVISYVLLAVMLLSFAACSSDVEPTTIDFDWGDDEISTDGLVGRDMKIWPAVGSGTDETYILNYQCDSPLGDELLERKKMLEEQHKCSISLISNLNGTTFPAAVISGLDPCDIAYIDLYTFRGIIKGGFILPVDEYSDVIDVTDSFRWGFPNALETMMMQGTLYGVFANSWPGAIGGLGFTLLCNSGILYKNGYTHPQEYVENGEWTREKLLEIIKNCYDPASEIYGLETYHEWWTRCCLYSNNVQYIIKRSDGTYAYGMDTDAARDGLEFATRTRNELGKAYFQTNEDYYFDAGQAAFHLRCSKESLVKYPYLSTIIDFSMPPFPSNPAFNPYDNWRGYLTIDNAAICIPVSVEDVHSAAQLIYEFFAPLAGIEDEDDLSDYYANNIFFSENEFKNLWKAMKSSEFSYSTDGESFTIFNQIIAANSVRTPTEAIEAHKDKAMAALEHDILPNKLAYEKYFGIDYFENYCLNKPEICVLTASDR